jgi:hypothetical protein
MSRKLHADGICTCCGRVGPTWAYVAAETPDLPPLCDRCEYAQSRWDAAGHAHPFGYPYWDGPPKSPPVRRGTAEGRTEPK